MCYILWCAIFSNYDRFIGTVCQGVSVVEIKPKWSILR